MCKPLNIQFIGNKSLKKTKNVSVGDYRIFNLFFWVISNACNIVQFYCV